MAGLPDLGRKGALDVLARLAEVHPAPLDAMAFAEAAGMAPNNAIRLREDLHLLRVIQARVVREQGAIREYEITLTPLGVELGEHALAMRRAFEKQREPRQRR